MIKQLLLSIILVLISSGAAAQTVFLEMEILSESIIEQRGNSLITITDDMPQLVVIGSGDLKALNTDISTESGNVIITIGEVTWREPVREGGIKTYIEATLITGEPNPLNPEFCCSAQNVNVPFYWDGPVNLNRNTITLTIYGEISFADNYPSTVYADSVVRLEFY